jgi:ferrochelatase
LLLAHGAPDRLEDVREFLLHVRRGQPLPEPAVQEIIRRYAQIGGGSPLLRLTRQQAEALAGRIGRPVYVGMRNWNPFIVEAVEEMAREGLQQVVAVCMAPHNSRTSVGLYREHLEEARKAKAPHLTVSFVDSWHNHPLLIQAFVEKLRPVVARAEANAGGAVPVILTAHSVPEHTIAAGDPYADQARETAAKVAAACGLSFWCCAFQSQGMTEELWIGPTVESQIDELAQSGHRHVVIAPIGFVSDHVEILYDIDIHFRNYALERGLTLSRPDSLNSSPALISALAALVEERIACALLRL